MKLLVRFSYVLLLVLTIVSFSSCTKKSYPASTGKYKRHTVALSNNPATPKKVPLRKHYIVPKKKKRILGSDYH